MATATSENFYGEYNITYNTTTGAWTITSTVFQFNDNGHYDKATDTTSGTATISKGDTLSFNNSQATTSKGTVGISGSAAYVGVAYNSSGTAIGIIVQQNGSYYLMASGQSASNLSGSGTTNTSQGWTMNGTSGTPICFMAGTMVATPAGEVAVETLKAGDLITLSDGRTVPVSWLGRQTVSTLFADPLRVNPIRIKANALADGVPSRDLLVSPDHALLVDGILIHAGALVNGVSIVREANVPKVFVYYHVEVADHSLILAENTPAETFVDNVDRMAFDNWEEHVAIVGDNAIPEMDYPRAKSARQVPSSTRARLSARAEALFATTASAAA